MTVTLWGSDLPQRTENTIAISANCTPGHKCGYWAASRSCCWTFHRSLGLICNNWLSSTTSVQMDSHIDYPQSKKKTQLSGTKHCSSQPHNITHSVIPTYVFLHAPLLKNMLLICHLCVCFCVLPCVCVYVCVWDGQPLFLHAGAAPIGFVQGSRIWGCVGDPSTLTGPL